MARLKNLKPRLSTTKFRLQPANGATGWALREQVRGNRHARGYGAAWDKLRVVILKRDKYLCQVCLASGRPEPATQVDHIVPKALGGTDDHSNCQSICTACHKAKTAKESRYGDGYIQA